MDEIELKMLPCSVCGKPVEVTPDKTTVKCLEHSPEYWKDIQVPALTVGEADEVNKLTGFLNEAGKVFVGRFLYPDQYAKWLLAQAKPTWGPKYICVHHTWSPTDEQWYGYESLKGIFRYYKYERGWPEGIGPHFWVAPFYHHGPWGCYVGTHPFRQGIGAVDWNYDTIHIETAWNGDLDPFSDEVLKALHRLLTNLRDWLDIPMQLVDFGSSGYAVKGRRGLLFHRDTPKAGKSCPGTKNSHDGVFKGVLGTTNPNK